MIRSQSCRRAAVTLGLSISLFLGGCATSGTQLIANHTSRLDSARVVAGFQDIRATPLPFSEPTVARVGYETVDGQQWAMELFGERTFVTLYALPAWSEPYSINVSSMMFGGVADPAIFYPRYVLLNEDFSVARQSKAQDFVYRTGMGEGMISSTFFVNDDNRKERFLAIVAEPRTTVTERLSLSHSSGAVPLVIPVKGGSLTWLIRTGGNEDPKRMRAAAGGTVRIKAELYKPKRIGG